MYLLTPSHQSRTGARFVTLGRDPYGRLFAAVYTWRGERIRLISARDTTSRERRDYEKGSP